jgi:hypothetical protein
VVDRFFETKGQALAWASKNPAFMTVRVLPPSYRRQQVVQPLSRPVQPAAVVTEKAPALTKFAADRQLRLGSAGTTRSISASAGQSSQDLNAAASSK